MQAPVIVMNDASARQTGRKAQTSNITAAKVPPPTSILHASFPRRPFSFLLIGQVVSDVIRTCLGPKAMLKMLLDPMGGVLITNDGHAILREIDVAHPAAKSMIELSRTQDEEVGDGTTTVIILGLTHLHPLPISSFP
jgi:T-complex protein 1 subunit gamma